MEGISVSISYSYYDDYWKDRVPESIRRRFPDLTEALDCLDKQSDNKGAALSIFWKIYELSEKKLLAGLKAIDIPDRINGLEQKLSRELREEMKAAKKDISRFFVYLHIAGALIVLLEDERKDDERKDYERFIETVEAMEQSCKFYFEKLEDLESEPLLIKSAYAVRAIMAAKLYELRDSQGEYEDALMNLVDAIQLVEYADFDAVGELDPQLPVNTFEKLWDNPEKATNWADIADYCDCVSWYEPFFEQIVKWKGEEFDGLHFWVYARGLCTSRLSPSEFVKASELQRFKEAETRLKNYFFYNSWDNIPDDIRRKLKNIDSNWFLPGKEDFGDIVLELTRVTQDLIRMTLWDPFIQWRHSSFRVGTGTTVNNGSRLSENEQRFDGRLQELKHKKKEPALGDFADMIKLPSFEKFLHEQMPFLDLKQKEFLKKLLSP